MRITTIVLMALVCVAQTACVSQRETIPPETRVELKLCRESISRWWHTLRGSGVTDAKSNDSLDGFGTSCLRNGDIQQWEEE
jgi:hypothetical protein